MFWVYILGGVVLVFGLIFVLSLFLVAEGEDRPEA